MTQVQTLSVSVPQLETQRLRFRAPSVDDFQDEVAFYASERSRGVGGPVTMEAVWSKLTARMGQWSMLGYGVWSLDSKDTGEYIGRVGIFHPADWPEPELAWTMMEAGEGKGFALEAALAVRKFVYDTMGWNTLISIITDENTRSIALAERLGCTREDDFHHFSYGPLRQYRHPGPEVSL